MKNSGIEDQGTEELHVREPWPSNPVLIINTVIQQTNISQFIFNDRSVFVVAASALREGERDYSEQTLATPTLQISHFLRGVVNLVLVRVKVQGVNICF